MKQGLIISAAECSRGHVQALFRSHVCCFFFTSHDHHFYFGGVAEASVYFNMTRKTDAGHSCMDVQSDKDLMGRQVWLFNLQRVFREVKWLR